MATGKRALNVVFNALRECAESPMERAHTMPPVVYRSPELLALEKEKIFAADWHCPGLAAEIPEIGDYLTFQVADQPIVVIRGKDGDIRSFSNVCLHRMMRLAEGRGNCRRLICPYHAWTYGLDGRLIGAGHMGRTAGFRDRAHVLLEIRTEVWEGWIYVTLNPKAVPIAELLAPLGDVVGQYGMADYVPVTTQDHVWQTNWKLLTENFMEGYHLPVAHRETVGAWFPAGRTAFVGEEHDAFTYQTFVKSEAATYGLAHRDNTRLKGDWRITSVMPTVFPCHMYVLAPDHLWYLSLMPKGVGEVHVRFGAALAPEVVATMVDRDQFVGELVAFFDEVNREDREVVEGVYANTAAPLAQAGPLSWLEESLNRFARYLTRRLVPKPAKVVRLRNKTA